jgi:hypothetical protein
LRASTVPDSNCRNVLSMTVAAVVIYFFFLGLAFIFIGSPVFLDSLLAAAIPALP